MKKAIAIVLTAALLAALFAVPGFASGYGEKIDVLMSDPEVVVGRIIHGAKEKELKDAIENGSELIPEECKLVPERITVMQTGTVSSDEEYFYVTFKVWSTVNRTIALFFMPESTGEWELLSCNLGDVIEGRFEDCGTYAIVVGW